VIAEHLGWRGGPELRLRAATEEFACDSFENLLFGICRFYESVGRFPETVGVVSWMFKRRRFQMHREAIKWPATKYQFFGVNNPVDLETAMAGEEKVIADFAADPLGAERSSVRNALCGTRSTAGIRIARAVRRSQVCSDARAARAQVTSGTRPGIKREGRAPLPR